MASSLPDISVNTLELDLVRGSEKTPLQPLVRGMSVTLSDVALEKAIHTVLEMAKSRMSVEVEYEDSKFVPGGAEVTVSAGLNRFLRAKATAVIGISASKSQQVSVEIQEIRTLGKISIESFAGPMIEKALSKASAMPGIDRDTGRSRGLLIDPGELLRSNGVPVSLAYPGGWTVEPAAGILNARFETI
ncbi:hypothetical protein BH23CHL5_BH23CHL5_21230 [soil metagenome]